MTKFADYLYDEFRKWEGRSKRKSSLSAFARYLGIPQASLSMYMSDSRLPEEENIDKLAAKLGPQIYDILGKPRRMPDDPRLRQIANSWHLLTDEQREELLQMTLKKTKPDIAQAGQAGAGA